MADLGRLPSVVFSDVDGTILDNRHRVTARTAQASRALAQAGVALVLVSARMPEALAAIRQELGNTGPTICYSGAYVLDSDGSELLSRPMALEHALRLHDFVSRELPGVTCMAYGYHSWVVDSRLDPRVAREEQIVGVESVEGTLEEHFSGRGLHKLLLVGEPKDIERAEREVGVAFPDLSAVRSSPILCEVMDGRASKIEGIRVVCDRLGVSISNVLAIGDGRNDIDMLRSVPRSWAMANAPREVRAAASRVTAVDNEHDGFAETMISILSSCNFSARKKECC